MPVLEDQEAITFSACGVQEGLRDTEILKGIIVKKGENFIKKIIEERPNQNTQSTTFLKSIQNKTES